MNEMDEIGLVLFLIIVGAFIAVFGLQYCRREAGTERLVVLNVRTALFLPLYALLMFISLVAPNALAALNVPITFVEGYSFYCFYSMIVTNLGGPSKAVHAFKSTGKELACCQSCCPSDHVIFYRRTIWALFHMIWTRTVIMIFSAICFYSGTKAGKALYAVLSLVSTVILVYALVHIILFYENVYQSCTNLFGMAKAALIKVSVGLIVLEGNVAQFMTVTGAEPYNDDSSWSAADKTLRGYCLLVLIEFIVLTIPYLFAFGCYKMTPKEPPSTQAAPAEWTLCGFFCQVLKIWDVFGYLTYRDDNSTTKVLTS